MLSIYASLLPVFMLIAIGFGLRKLNVIPEEQWRGIERLVFWILLPALLILVLADASLGIGEALTFAMAILGTIIFMCLAAFLARRPLQRWFGADGPAFTTVFQTTTRWHGFIALAVADKLFGAPGLALLAVVFVVMVPVLNTSSILVLAAYAGKDPAPGRIIVRSLVSNPIMWGLIIGLIIRFSGVVLPDIATSTLELAGDGALGVSLLALGAGLSWRAVRKTSALVVVASFAKLIVYPLVGIGFALMFGVTGMAFVIVVLATAVPTAVNGYVLAREMGGDAELYAATLTAQVVVSFITLPLFMWGAMVFTGLA